ncbi:Dynein heavy chain 3, axonemal [Boothiomyces sp. JEL0866]|nr:Dynein heavy chain 3, axonemal [Boothiomyces sp. JEL0866]
MEELQVLLNTDQDTAEEYLSIEKSIKEAYKSLNDLNLIVEEEDIEKFNNRLNNCPPLPTKSNAKPEEDSLDKLQVSLKKKKSNLKSSKNYLSSQILQINKHEQSTADKRNTLNVMFDENAFQRVIPKTASDFNLVFTQDLNDQDFQAPSFTGTAQRWRTGTSLPISIIKVERANSFSNQFENVKPKVNSRPVSAVPRIAEEPEPKIRKPKRKKSKKKKILNLDKDVAEEPKKGQLIPETKKLPLEWFDNPKFLDTKSPEEWAEFIKRLSAKDAVSLSRYHNISATAEEDWKWGKCKVLEYDINTEMFLIEWIELGGRKWVRRFNLLFPGENLDAFSRRMEHASTARNEYEMLEKCEKEIKTTTLEKLAPYPPSFRTGILKRVGPISKQNEINIIEGCFKELYDEYVNSMKKVDYSLKVQLSSSDQAIQKAERFTDLALSKFDVEKEDLGGYIYSRVAAVSRGLSDYMFHANPNLQLVLNQILVSLRNIIQPENHFFSFTMDFPVKFLNFTQRAISHCELIQTKLVHEWPLTIANLIETKLGDFFKLSESNYKSYLDSRCYSFMSLVNSLMEGQVHNLLIHGLLSYLAFFNIRAEVVGEKINPASKSYYLSYFSQHKLIPPKFNQNPKFLIIHVGIANVKVNNSVYGGKTSKLIEDVSFEESNEVVLTPTMEEVKESLISTFKFPLDLTENRIPTISSLLMANLKEEAHTHLHTVESDSMSVYEKGKEILLKIIDDVTPRIERILYKYKAYEYLIQNNPLEKLTLNSPLEDFYRPVEIINEVRSEISDLSRDQVEVLPFIIDCSIIKNLFMDLSSKSFLMISDLLSQKIRNKCNELLSVYDALSEQIQLDPGLVALWWKDLKTAIANCRREYDNFQIQFEDVQNTWQVMYNYTMPVPDEVNQLYWKTYEWPSTMSKHLASAESKLKNSKKLICARIQREIGYVFDTVDNLQEQLVYFNGIDDINQSFMANRKVKSLVELVESTIALVGSIKKQEEAMELPVSTFPTFEEVIASYRMYDEMWQLVDDVHTSLNEWINEWFMNLNADIIVNKVQSWNTTLFACFDNFKTNVQATKVLNQLKIDIDDFWRNTSVITFLRNPALKPHHWEKISSVIGLSLNDFQTLRLVEILDLDLELVQTVIADITNQAVIGYKHDQLLDKMKGELTLNEFSVETIPNEETSILTNIDLCQNMLEDQLIRCEKVFNSVDDNESKVKFEKWVTQIHKALEMLNLINELQRFYVRHLPIFRSYSNLAIIDSNLVEFFTSASKSITIALDVFTKNRKFINLIYRSDLFESIAGAMKRVVHVKENISITLQAKRIQFPRFYFVTDEHMLDTLTCTTIEQLSKTVYHYFPSIGKLLEGYKVVEFKAPEQPVRASARGALVKGGGQVKKLMEKKKQNEVKVPTVEGFYGFSGERIAFSHPYEFKEVDFALMDLEKNMVDVLRHHFLNAYQSTGDIDINEKVIRAYPCQILVVAYKNVIDKQLARLLDQWDKYKFREFRNALLANLENILELLRSPKQAMDFKIKLESVASLYFLYFSNTEDLNSAEKFDLYNLKYTVEDPPDIYISVNDSKRFKYGFEYIDGGCKLNITPSISQAFYRIIYSLSSHKLPLLCGPKGYGKLSAIGEFCFYLGFPSKFFSGNIIDKYFLKNLMLGIQATYHTVIISNFHLLADELHELLSTLELRNEYLKSSFLKLPFIFTVPNQRSWGSIFHSYRNKYRLVGMMKKDMCAYLEAVLTVKNFKQAKILAKKISLIAQHTQLIFQREILNSSNIKYIVDLAIQSKGMANGNEFIQVKNAIIAFFKSAVSATDLNAVKDVVNSVLKMQLDADGFNDSEILELCEKAFTDARLSPLDYFCHKVSQLVFGIQAKRNIILLGGNYTGKSTVLNMALHVKNKLLPKGTFIKLHRHFPDAINLERLIYKSVNAREGLSQQILHSARLHVSKMMQLCHPHAASDHRFSWIALDGDICNQWPEIVDTIVCYESSPHFKAIDLIYETTTLSNYAPNLMSKSSIVYIEPKQLKWDILITNELLDVPKVVKKQEKFIQQLHETILVPTMKYLQIQSFWPSDYYTEKLAHVRVLKMLLCLIVEKGTKGYERLTTNEQSLWILFSFIFSVIWTVGNNIIYERKVEFDRFFRDLLGRMKSDLSHLEAVANLSSGYLRSAMVIPEDNLVFDYIVDDKLTQWIPWPNGNEEKLYGYHSNPITLFACKDLIRVTYFSRLFIRSGTPIVISGQRGVGKTKNLIASLNNLLEDQAKFFEDGIGKITISRNTTNESFQNQFSKNTFKKRYNARGSQDGRRKIIFVEDLHCASYIGVHNSPIETIRMICDSKAWFSDTDVIETVNNIQLTAEWRLCKARNDLTCRIARYFLGIVVDDNEKIKMVDIFTAALTNKFSAFDPSFPTKCIDATFDIYQKLKTTLSPTPTSPHLQFLMRDIATIFRGLLCYPQKVTNWKTAFEIWSHCMLLTFKNRLVESEVDIYNSIESETTNKYFEVELFVNQITKHDYFYTQPDVIISFGSGPAELKITDLNVLINSIRYRNSWISELGSLDELHTDALVISNQMAYTYMNMNSHVILLDSYYHFKLKATQLCSFLIMHKFVHYEPRKIGSTEEDEDVRWVQHLKNILKLQKSDQPVLLFFDYISLSDDQLLDVISIMKYGIPACYFDKVNPEKKVMFDDKQTGMEKFCEKAKALTKICISLPSMDKCLEKQIFIAYPNFLSLGTIFQLQLTSSLTLENYIRSKFKELNFIQNIDLSPVASFINWGFSNIPSILSEMYSNQIEEDLLSPDALIIAAQEFARQYVQHFKAKAESRERLESAIGMIDKSFESMENTQQEYQQKKEKAEQANQETQGLLEDIENDRNSIELNLADVKKDTEINSRYVEEIEYLRNLCATEMEKVIPPLQEAIAGVELLDRADIYDLKGLADPSKSILTVLECVVILLKFEVRPGEHMWDAIKRMISEKYFISNIKNCVEDSHHITPVIVHIVDRMAKGDIFNSKDITNNATLVLRNWVVAYTKYNSANLILNQKRKLLEETEVKSQEKDAAILDSKNRITELENQIKQKRVLFGEMIKKHEETNYSLKELEHKLVAASNIKGSLESLKLKFLDQLDKIIDAQNTLISQCVISSSSLVMLGHYSNNIRLLIRKKWLMQLSDFGLPMLEDAFDPLNIYEPVHTRQSVISYDLPFDDNIYESMLMAKYSHKIPLILDKLQIANNWFQVIEKDSKIEFLHINTSNVIDKIETAAGIERKVVLFVTPNPDHSLVEKIIDLVYKIQQEGVKGVAGLSVKEFRLYMVLHSEFSDIFSTESFKKCLNAISITYSSLYTEKIIGDFICKIHNEDLKKKNILSLSENIQLKLRLDVINSRAIDFTKSLVDGDIYGGNLFQTIVDTDSQLNMIIQKIFYQQQTIESYTNMLQPYRILGKSLAPVYESLSSMISINPKYVYSMEEFLNICREKSAMLQTVITEEVSKAYCEEVVKYVYYSFVPGLKVNDRSIFGFQVATAVAQTPIYQKDENLVFPKNYVKFLFLYIAPERNRDQKSQKPLEAVIKNPAKYWLAESKWKTIVDLSNFSRFHAFALDFSKYANRATTPQSEASWQEIFEARDPLKVQFPVRWHFHLTRVEKYLVYRIIRPDCLSLIMDEYSKSVLGSGVVEIGYPNDLLLQRYQLMTSYKPLIFYNEDLEDPVILIQQLNSKFSSCPMLVTNSNSIHDTLETTVQNSINSGTWLTVCLQNSSPDEIDNLCRKLTKVLENPSRAGSSFRLFIISNGSEPIPYAFLANALKMFKEQSQEFRYYLNDAIRTLELKHISIDECDESYKKLLFNFCVFYSAVKYRLIGIPLVIDNALQITIPDISWAIKKLTAINNFVTKKVDINAEADILYLFRSIVEKNWGSQFQNETDIQWSYELFKYIMAIKWPEMDETVAKLNLPPLKHIYDLFAQNSITQVLEQVAKLPRGIYFEITSLGCGENVFILLESFKSQKVLEAFQKLYPNDGGKIDRGFHRLHLLLPVLKEFHSKLISEQKHSWCRNTDAKVNKTVVHKDKTRLYPKSMELFARENFILYKAMLLFIINSVSTLVAQIEGDEFIDPTGLKSAEEILNDKVPSIWTASGKCFPTSQTFSSWTTDFLARLGFTRAWFTIKYEGKKGVSTKMIYYDITKLFKPEDFIPAMLLDSSVLMNEPVENIEIETVLVSERQKTPPDRGVYVSGLFLYGAAFDYHKNVIKAVKPSELAIKMPSIWIFPKMKMNSESAKKSIARPNVLRKSIFRLQCPIYSLKTHNTFFDKVKFGHKYTSESKVIGYITLTSEVPPSHWTLRNLFLACEKPELCKQI